MLRNAGLTGDMMIAAGKEGRELSLPAVFATWSTVTQWHKMVIVEDD